MANYWGRVGEGGSKASPHLSVSSRAAMQQAALRPRECGVCQEMGASTSGLPRPYLLHVHPSHSCLVPIPPGDKCSGDKFTVISETDPDGKFRLPPAGA